MGIYKIILVNYNILIILIIEDYSMLHFKSGYSFRVLLHMSLLFLCCLALGFYQYDFIKELYLSRQLTQTGLIINGSILTLFLLGIGRIIMLLLDYMYEERAIRLFIRNIKKFPITEIKGNKFSLIYQRYQALLEIHQQHAPIHHSSLAAALVARESTRISFPKFISNILILTGVFGTIISLSIALFGASELLDSDGGIAQMGLVIHGMSTALSTTTTAIVLYLFFGYFYLKLTDVQTHLISAIEQVCSIYLIPQLNYQAEDMTHELTSLTKSLYTVSQTMQAMHEQNTSTGQKMHHLLDQHSNTIDTLILEIQQIKKLLQAGFRLPPTY